jgi:hypothetical protein
MTVEELHRLYMQRLVRSFGVSTAMSAFWDDRAARAFGNHYSEDSAQNSAEATHDANEGSQDGDGGGE